MLNWRSVLVGGAATIGVYGMLTARWSAWFGGVHEPWFFNSGRAVAFTACVLAAAAFLAAAWLARDRREAFVHGANVAAGSIVIIVAILVAIGPGTIFPLVIFFGAMVAAGSAMAGAAMAAVWKPKRKEVMTRT